MVASLVCVTVAPRRFSSLRRLVLLTSFAVAWFAGTLAPARASAPTPAADILQEMRCFRELGSVLYIAAHPDDENNRLLPYLARGRAVRTGYLSLTRGDGGQNLIGPELGAELGVIRTQELLAARRIDGAQQFFSRAKDFGFSKDSEDTLKRWNRQEVLADIVRVIRTFRPDVIINRFSTVPGGTHGHHTASAILALEAFKLAGDPNAFPDQLEHLKPWQAKRIYWNSWVPPGSKPDPQATTIKIDAGGFDTLLGESFGETGARGRTMHKSQGEGRPGVRGPAPEYFQVLAGDPATSDIFDGVETSWRRYPAGAELDGLSADLIAHFDPLHPSASVPALLKLREKLSTLPRDPLVLEKQRQLDHLVQACLGLFVETVVTHAQVLPGETLSLRFSAVARDDVPVRWLSSRLTTLSAPAQTNPLELKPNEPASREVSVTLPRDLHLTQPYWLEHDGTEGMFRVDQADLIGRPENPPVLPVEHIFEVAGQSFTVVDEPVQVITDPVRGEVRRTVQVIPPVSLSWVQDLALFAPGSRHEITVELTAARANVQGEVSLAHPADWSVTPESLPFHTREVNEKTRVTFSVTAPSTPGSVLLQARASVDGAWYDRTRIELKYEHIPPQLLQPLAEFKGVCLDLATRGHTIGYIAGAGDLVGESLRRMGYAVLPLQPTELDPARLRTCDAVVLGVRAFNTRADLDTVMPRLFDYAEQGGTVLVQYNTSNGLLSSRFAPYTLELSRDRITDPHAAVTLLQPGHPALNVPNKISSADFEGWQQERARFVPQKWDAHFTPLLSMSDPHEAPLQGTLLIAPHGKGHIVYTSLSWFRELPAGVPGAYRLFANLVSLGK